MTMKPPLEMNETKSPIREATDRMAAKLALLNAFDAKHQLPPEAIQCVHSVSSHTGQPGDEPRITIWRAHGIYAVTALGTNGWSRQASDSIERLTDGVTVILMATRIRGTPFAEILTPEQVLIVVGNATLKEQPQAVSPSPTTNEAVEKLTA